MCVHVTNVFLMHDVFLIRASMSLCVPNVCVHVTITCMRACTHVHVPEPPCVYVYVCTHTHTHTHIHTQPALNRHEHLNSTDTNIFTQTHTHNTHKKKGKTSQHQHTRATHEGKQKKNISRSPWSPRIIDCMPHRSRPYEEEDTCVI